MSALAGNVPGSTGAALGRRWRALDPLLPEPAALPPGCGETLVVTGADGQPVACGACEHKRVAPGSLDAAWGATSRFELTAAVTGAQVTGALDRLLSLWGDHLADAPGAAEDESAAVVSWPNRDVQGVAALVRHGLAPMAVLAARVPRRPPGAQAGPAGTLIHRDGPAGALIHRDGPAGTLIRRAGPADAGTVARLALEVVRYDAHFGNGGERPGTLDTLRATAAELVSGPEPWAWLAERDGVAVGMLAAQRPPAAGWIAPMVRLAPAAYLMLAFVQPGERGTGLGAELAARFHREAGAAGVAVILVHYEMLNPLAAPFWSQQGYRPLWTWWEASPARAVR